MTTAKPKKPKKHEEPAAETSEPIASIGAVEAVVDFEPCPVCGTNRSALAPDAACPVDGFVPGAA